jgi:hypothetical protein
MSEMTQPIFNFRAPQILRDRVAAQAKLLGISRGALARMVIEAYLENQSPNQINSEEN